MSIGQEERVTYHVCAIPIPHWVWVSQLIFGGNYATHYFMVHGTTLLHTRES